MACDLTLGRLEPCYDQAGGVKSIYFINNVDGLLDSATIAATGQITAFATALTLFKYEIRGEEVHVFDETPDDNDNGTTSYTQNLTVYIKTQTLADRKELMILAYGHPQIVVLDYNGNYKLMGIENGCKVKVTATGGTALNDPTGYTITATGREKALAHYILSSIIDDTTNTSVTVGT